MPRLQAYRQNMVEMSFGMAGSLSFLAFISSGPHCHPLPPGTVCVFLCDPLTFQGYLFEIKAISEISIGPKPKQSNNSCE